jgi:hypothetical protein
MGPLHLAAAVLDAPPEVAAADDQANLDTHIDTLLDGGADFADLLKIQTEAIALSGLLTQRFTADLQQDALIFQFLQFFSLLLYVPDNPILF